jgi:predicted metalloprotease with PDZ domain
VNGLNAVLPYDWRHFLQTRLTETTHKPPLDGLARAGWHLAFTDEPSQLSGNEQATSKGTDFTYSIGLRLSGKGDITSVLWNGPAFKAGLSRGTKIIAVDGMALDDPGALRDAIKQAQFTTSPIQLIIQDGQHFRNVSIDYHDGLRYPHLQRVPFTPDRLTDIMAPLK